jgi:hypothetical protein
MPEKEQVRISLSLIRYPEKGYSTMGADWFKNMHQRGVWVKYDHSASHKEAFSMLCQGIWEALSDPDAHIVEQETREGTEPAPYWDNTR